MLPENIYMLRRKNGLSQEQLAEKIGVSRQAISKWEGGLSTPELDKIKALSECFKVTIDELTGNQPVSAYDDIKKEKENIDCHKTEESKIGICLCLIGAVFLILFGIVTIMYPSYIEQVNESSMIVLNGTGILIISFLLLMILGIILILRKK